LTDLSSKIRRAQALHRDGRLDDARVLCEDILREEPECFEALSLFALIAAQRGEFALALAGYDRVVAVKPDFADAYANRGASLAALNRWVEALSNFDRAISLKPEHVEAHLGRAIVWLSQGDFARGWAEFEWRWKTAYGRALLARKGLSRPLWLGAQDIAGKTILLYCEKGLGDTLQFCRYVRLVRDLGAIVFLQVQDPLMELLAHVEGASQVLSDTRAPPPCDVHCALLSLPLALNIGPATIPTGKYLSASPARTARWQTKLGESPRPRVGLAWRGDPDNPIDRGRSMGLSQLLPYLPGGFHYLSLQKDLSASERRIAAAHPIEFLPEQALDFAETAALCECMDLVISVDTSIAHLSAALGQKTWILLPFNADCRWLLDRSDSPWYPSVRLYRQIQSGDWHGVLSRIAADLKYI
jgi:hypothetical protein